MPEQIHCSICGKVFRVKNFKDALEQLRHHRNKKGVATRKRNK